MSPIFGKKDTVQALAEILEDGRAIFSEEMKKIKYREYVGPEPMLQIRVRVQPENEPPFEAVMKAGISHSLLLKQGVRLRVKYEPQKHAHVEFDDADQAIIDRNPQLVKKA